MDTAAAAYRIQQWYSAPQVQAHADPRTATIAAHYIAGSTSQSMIEMRVERLQRGRGHIDYHWPSKRSDEHRIRLSNAAYSK
jgi:hypothetical protein